MDKLPELERSSKNSGKGHPHSGAVGRGTTVAILAGGPRSQIARAAQKNNPINSRVPSLADPEGESFDGATHGEASRGAVSAMLGVAGPCIRTPTKA